MRKIKLNQGKYALVDDEDYVWLNSFKWYYSQGYARKNQWLAIEKRYVVISMARLVNQTPPGYETDHKNLDTLDNRKDNLRTVTHQQNNFNKVFNKNNTTGHRGVHWDKRTKRWYSRIMRDRKSIHLGYFGDISDAIRVRKQAEKIYHAI